MDSILILRVALRFPFRIATAIATRVVVVGRRDRPDATHAAAPQRHWMCVGSVEAAVYRAGSVQVDLIITLVYNSAMQAHGHGLYSHCHFFRAHYRIATEIAIMGAAAGRRGHPDATIAAAAT